MKWLVQFLRSSIGAKFVMAVTGVGLFGFVIGHMLGNLQMFLGQDALNNYAKSLKDLGPLLWVPRIGLLVCVTLHILTAVRLTRENRQARPMSYVSDGTVQATFASRTMFRTGVIILAFVVFHLLHLTFGAILPENYALEDGMQRHDVYSMTVLGFQNWLVTGSYIVAMVPLGFHLSHGVTSLFQSLGLHHPRYNPLIAKIGPVSAAIIVVGNVSMPLACLLGIVQLPGGGA